LAAFGEIARERFVEPALSALAYSDSSMPALKAAGRPLLAPAVLARLIQAAGPRAGERALDVGGGSGYSAAVLARLGVHVVALETAKAAEGLKSLLGADPAVEIITGDLREGAPSKAPFDLILVNGAFEIAPVRLTDQLAQHGRLVGVDASFQAPKAVLIEKVGAATSRRTLFDAAAPRVEEFRASPEFAF
ncbi:MAG TPA: methyltransferase domain-containing protein, partial [Roseiarcus sp.]|nr:methyltransferase domain-containing protein [Roseiarcus sp.]